MSLFLKIRTGLSQYEWERLWAQLCTSPHTQIEALSQGFENWFEAVVAEGKNRQFVHYAFSGKHISLRKGIAEVVNEMKAQSRGEDLPVARIIL